MNFGAPGAGSLSVFGHLAAHGAPSNGIAALSHLAQQHQNSLGNDISASFQALTQARQQQDKE
jgi:hypothetical protein